MSSDYGSDIDQDDISVIESSQPVVPATPRMPLIDRDVNSCFTPPPLSQVQKRKASDSPLDSQVDSQRTKRKKLPWNAPATTAPSVQRASQKNLPRNIPATPQRTSTIPSSQPLPSPAASSQTSPSPYHPFSSSQPTPSRQASAPYPPGTSQHGTPKTPSEAMLYRFPFGSYSGKSFFEVPESYLSYLRIDQVMADSMPGFAAALRLFDAGQAPFVSLHVPPVQPPQEPPCNSQASVSSSKERPIKSEADAQLLASVPSPPRQPHQREPRIKSEANLPLSQELPANSQASVKQEQEQDEHSLALAQQRAKELQEDNAKCLAVARQREKELQEYRFNFGMHLGKILAQVPRNYLDFLQENGIVATRADLAAAITSFNTKQATDPPLTAPRPSDYVLCFGKYKGQKVANVSRQYLEWLETTELLEQNPDLNKAVMYEMRTRKPPKPSGRIGSSKPRCTFECTCDRRQKCKIPRRTRRRDWLDFSYM
ncbi:hypothetical protein OPT61_g4506 [Boeremia exigua]|uniref:Uncharacterized protein n=1 Tax=Boeremia exigua TaxID=749465 RepID=A0ACC2IDQ4_9PLEO|nr:hypothetical protein OPT61_g4506 [Boeremia exigua]